MKKIEEFAGYLTSLIEKDEMLEIRLTPWSVLDDENPVLLVQCEGAEISSLEGLTFEFVRENECEVDEIEYHENKLSVWVYDYESPIVITGSKIGIDFVPYNHQEYRSIINSKEEHYKQLYSENSLLRNKLNQLESFIDQHEQRIQAKAINHPEGTDGYKIYKEQLKILSKIRSRLST